MAALLHIIFNWRPLLSYFRTRWGEASGLRLEWIAALILGVVVYTGTRANRPPLPGRGGGGSEPGGGPGRKKLTESCADEGIDLQTALKRLDAKGIKASINLTMREIAVNNGYERPYELLGILRGENR